MSGFSASSPTRGPRLEKSASSSSRSTAPTASPASALAGEPTEPSEPSLPAARTNSVPVCAVRVCTASSTGSTSGVSQPLRLMLTTAAFFSTAAHCMPARIAESLQPASSQTLPSSSVASGATPRYLPPEAAPVPAMVEATWVPWPTVSRASATSVKLRASATLPARSGWVASTPVSSTATDTPVPVNPAAQAVGAPICGTLWSRVTRRRPSSQIRSTPPAASSLAPAGPVVTSSQTAPREDLSLFRAAPRITGRSRVSRVPGRAAGARRALPVEPYDASSGRVLRWASS
ncbi:hypothetical protein ONO86_02401 [Micromonospora noduli]|nr:hypothetical protein ONO86_02401 [Micromonospora noduli]